MVLNEKKLLEVYKPDFAIGYGSGIMNQSGYADDQIHMMDFIFGVKNPLDWHRVNVKNSPEDYSRF